MSDYEYEYYCDFVNVNMRENVIKVDVEHRNLNSCGADADADVIDYTAVDDVDAVDSC